MSSSSSPSSLATVLHHIIVVHRHVTLSLCVVVIVVVVCHHCHCHHCVSSLSLSLSCVVIVCRHCVSSSSCRCIVAAPPKVAEGGDNSNRWGGDVVMVGACYGRWWLGGVLSVERGYGVCWPLVALSPPSLPSHRCSSSLLLLWTATMVYVATIRHHGIEPAAAHLLLWWCGVAASFLSLLVVSVCRSGGQSTTVVCHVVTVMWHWAGHLLWPVTWRHGGVVGVWCGGGGQLTTVVRGGGHGQQWWGDGGSSWRMVGVEKEEGWWLWWCQIEPRQTLRLDFAIDNDM